MRLVYLFKFNSGVGAVTPVFCVSSITGDKMKGDSASHEIGKRGLELMMTFTSAIIVDRTS